MCQYKGKFRALFLIASVRIDLPEKRCWKVLDDVDGEVFLPEKAEMSRREDYFRHKAQTRQRKTKKGKMGVEGEIRGS